MRLVLAAIGAWVATGFLLLAALVKAAAEADEANGDR